eukprot:CAMPEP_0198238776 /NCGR_PEP_ID=MMETSP1446-20131203/4339_1 /TAXON_ID=1461542 ORGANISM="Unidentified sp, Strain CCMP2111" /NCGR_SAMPLE_ID=MMETSP1446 /ASSEMBLY_ACC=CAM_ASM_001112 /LENGTH=337 /DNA_ID=CAMNT_0043921243 /DNA_START=292 /DNA_END=1305 /DNA_ORIENTATION=+
MAEDSYKVWETKALVRRRNVKEAEAILERVAKQVQPLMKRRRWKVRLVREFYPKSDSLLGLNVNKGLEVRLRLRLPGDPDTFYPYESILGTMLHELCHNVHGPHNASFYKLLDEITEEVERDMVNGVYGTGAGFDARGERLGGRGIVPIHNPPREKIRSTMLKAVEGRLSHQQLMSHGPQRLGGSKDFDRGLTPAQAAAKAAERRIRDDMWCPTEGIVESIVLDDGRDVGSAEEESLDVSRGQPETQGGAEDVSNRSLQGTAELPMSSGSKRMAKDQEVIDLTLDDEPRPSKSAKPTWACKFCTLVNPESTSYCEACEHWRFSHGEPVASGVKWNLT